MNLFTAVLSREQPELIINACCPGWISTDMGRIGDLKPVKSPGKQIVEPREHFRFNGELKWMEPRSLYDSASRILIGSQGDFGPTLFLPGEVRVRLLTGRVGCLKEMFCYGATTRKEVIEGNFEAIILRIRGEVSLCF